MASLEKCLHPHGTLISFMVQKWKTPRSAKGQMPGEEEGVWRERGGVFRNGKAHYMLLHFLLQPMDLSHVHSLMEQSLQICGFHEPCANVGGPQ